MISKYDRSSWRWVARCLLMATIFLTACTAETPPPALKLDQPATVDAGQVAEISEELPPTQIPSTDTPPPTRPAAATASLAPTELPPATTTPVPTTAPTVTLAPSLTPTIAPSLTPKPSPTTEPGRYCPPTSPLKPEYNRFYLSANKWPQPEAAVTETHFWMAKPLPGAGRVLINQRFPYGWDENGRLLLHNGVDMAEDLGTPVVAVADGTVIVAQSDYSAWYGWRCDWYGHLVVVELDEQWQGQPIYALYGHVLNLAVEPGQRVSRGQPVAEVGFGGAATHPHLHFEVRVGENEFAETRNPMLWIDPGPTRGVIVGRLVDPEGRPWQGVPIALVSDETNEIAHSTWSYLGDPQNLMNPDEGWAENFVFSDVPPGSYQVATQIQGVQYSVPVMVVPGEVSSVELLTESYKPPTPETADLTPGTAEVVPENVEATPQPVEAVPTETPAT